MGLRALGELLGVDQAQLGVAPVNWRKYATGFSNRVLPPFLGAFSVADGPDAPEPLGTLEEISAAPADEHPALGHQGLDYVGMRGASSSIVLGVTTNPKEHTSFQMLLRALNCFAEIAPPFQVARLRSQVEWFVTLGEQRHASVTTCDE